MPFVSTLLLALLWVPCAAGDEAADALLERSRSLIAAGRGATAYELLRPHATTHAGDAEFDYLFGVAAIDSGRPHEAVFALERVVAQYPQDYAARAELARAYFELGDEASATKEFTRVARGNLPAGARARINQYLTVLRHDVVPQRAIFSGWLGTGVGYDSNVNSASDDQTVSVPSIDNLSFVLAPNALELGSRTWELAGALAFSSPERSGLNVYGGVHLETVIAYEADFTTSTADGYVGGQYLHDDERFRLSVSAEQFDIDGHTFRDFAAVHGEWQHAFDAASEMALYAQFAAQRFPQDRVRDVNSYSVGVAGAHAFDVPGTVILFTSVFAGSDLERSSSRKDVGRDFAGARIGAQANLPHGLMPAASLTYIYSRFGADDPVLLKRRHHNYLNFIASLTMALSDTWSVIPEVRYTDNKSSLQTSEYDRVEFTLRFRGRF